MPTSKAELRRILDRSLQQRTRGELYWYPVAIGDGRDRGVALSDAVPLIPVGWETYDPLEPMTSQHEMHLLLELIRSVRPELALRAELTTLAVVQDLGLAYFVYGEHDHVCPGCGAINGDCICVAIHDITHDPPLPADAAGADAPLIDSSPTNAEVRS